MHVCIHAFMCSCIREAHVFTYSSTRTLPPPPQTLKNMPPLMMLAVAIPNLGREAAKNHPSESSPYHTSGAGGGGFTDI